MNKQVQASTDHDSDNSYMIKNKQIHHNVTSKFTQIELNSVPQGVSRPGIVKKSSLWSNDADRRPALRVQIIKLPLNKLRKKGSGDTPAAVSPAFSDSSFTLPATPRRRWLDSVFKFKPVTYQLLSTHDGFTSREECRRMLVNMGVRVVLTHAEQSGVLKCRTNDTKDLSGFLPALKSVRFRVEVQRPTPVQITAGYQVVLQLIQERGALSSFQSTFQPHRNRDGGYEFSERLVYVD
ncbi:hypothetical protein C8R48DRAFT_768122 [Suillus tomentosus]|nr:hypothetical protein C8R48DRAFT_768122 [Suillus tomentosus]